MKAGYPMSERDWIAQVLKEIMTSPGNPSCPRCGRKGRWKRSRLGASRLWLKANCGAEVQLPLEMPLSTCKHYEQVLRKAHALMVLDCTAKAKVSTGPRSRISPLAE